MKWIERTGAARLAMISEHIVSGTTSSTSMGSSVFNPTTNALASASEFAGGTVGDIVAGGGARSTQKKTYDWLLDEQFDNIQLLAFNCGWFTEPFEKLLRGEGREVGWRLLVENENPELTTLPENLDTQCSLLQKACVFRAFRPDRVLQSCVPIITQALGKKSEIF